MSKPLAVLTLLVASTMTAAVIGCALGIAAAAMGATETGPLDQARAALWWGPLLALPAVGIGVVTVDVTARYLATGVAALGVALMLTLVAAMAGLLWGAAAGAPRAPVMIQVAGWGAILAAGLAVLAMFRAGKGGRA